MPANMNLVRLHRKLEQIQSEVKVRVERSLDDDGEPKSDIFATLNPDITMSMGEYLAARAEEMEKTQKEIEDYVKSDGAMAQIDTLIALGKEKATHTPAPSLQTAESIGDALVKSEGFQKIREKKATEASFDKPLSLKDLLGSGSNAADSVNVEVARNGDYVTLPRTRVTLLDIIPQLPTTERNVAYDREIKNESAMDRVFEGGIYQESEFTMYGDTANIVKTGAFIQVSEELLADMPEIRARLNTALVEQMARRLQSNVIGNDPIPAAEYVGSPADISAVTGILEETSINTIDGNTGAGSGNFHNPYSLIQQAIEVIYRTGEADATAIAMNSQDWVMYATLQTTTGAFVARGSLNGLAGETQRMIEGIPVVLCNALPNNTVLVGDFANHCVIRDRQSVQVRIQEAQSFQVAALSTNVHTNPSGRFNIYVDARMGFYVRRPQAFCSITDFGVPF